MGGAGLVVLLTRDTPEEAYAVAAAVVLYVAVAVVGLLLLRRPSRRARQAGETGTGFAPIVATREALRRGEPLDPAGQGVADDLARVVQRRGQLGRSAGAATTLMALVVALGLWQASQSGSGSQLVAALTVAAVVVGIGVAERRRTAAVRRDLLASSRRR